MLKNPKVKNIFLISMLILAIVFVVVSYYYSQVVPTQIEQIPDLTENEIPTDVPEEFPLSEPIVSEVSPTVAPTPRPLPHGKRSFVVSLPSNVKGPRIGKGTIDPYDPALNGQQSLIIEVNDTVPVNAVVAILKTDNKTVEHALVPTTPGQMKGNWTGAWTMDDSYDYTYVLSVRATSANGTTMADLTTR